MGQAGKATKRMKIAAGAAAALFVIGSGVVAVSRTSSDGSGESAFVLSGGADAMRASGAGGSGGGAELDQGQVVPESLTEPRIVKSATLRIDVKDGAFARAFARVATIASSAGGFVASSTSSAGDDPSGSVTLRVPADRFDEVRGRLADLGELEYEQLAGDDVGAQIADMEARLRNLRVQEDAIRGLMARAGNVQETLQVQQQLGGVREQIERLEAQHRHLTDAVSYSTITAELSEGGAAVAGGSRIGDALARAARGAEAMVVGVIVMAGYLLPLALLVAAVVAAVRFGRRFVSLPG